MDYIVLAGVPPYDGRYELAVGDGLTTREWGWIKRLAGYLPVAVDLDTFGDPEFICVLAAISLRRAGKVEAVDVPMVFGQLSDAPPEATFRVESEEEQDAEALPPTPSSNENGSTSGEPSPSNSETLVLPPRATGTADLDISASDRPTSVS